MITLLLRIIWWTSPHAERFSKRAALLAFAFFVGGYGVTLWARGALSNSSTLSPDAQLSIAVCAFAAAALAVGFLVTHLFGGVRIRELDAASIAFTAAAFFGLRALKIPSFSYDRFFASPSEIAIIALISADLAVFVALIGSSVSLLLGGQHLDTGFAYEKGIARTHLRLTRKNVLVLAVLALVLPGVVYGLGVIASLYFKTVRATPLQIAAGFGALAAALFLVGRWLVLRARLSQLSPGQRRRRPATAVMTAISIAGVSIGVLALTVVLSVMSGFEADLKRKILGTNSHGFLLKYGSGDFSEWKSVLPKVTQVPGVVGATPFILNEVMIAEKDSLTGAELKGIDPATAGTVSDLPRQAIAGELSWIADTSKIPATPVTLKEDKAAGMGDLEDYQLKVGGRRGTHPEESSARRVDPAALAKMPGICVGKEMSSQLRVWVGDVVNVITPLGDVGPTGPVPRSRAFRVACILYSGMYEYDSKFAYIALAEAQKFFRQGDNVTGLELKFHDVDAARAIGRRVVAALGGYPYRAKDWAELNRNLFSALKLEKLAMAIILTFIVLVACFNILSTLIMLVLEKTKEISILKSMGARDASVMKIFVIEGLSIGGIGTGIGLLLGLAVCSFIERYGLRLDPDVYYISNLPVNVDGGQFLAVAAISLALSYLATLYPSIKASRLSPVDGLREE